MWRSIEQLVNQQVLIWTEAQRVAMQALDESSPGGNSARLRELSEQAAIDIGAAAAPSICISREFGTYAGDLAKEVRERLGLDVYDQELVDAVSRMAHVRRKVVESLDERVQSGIAAWAEELITLHSFTPSDYLSHLSQVVLTIGRHGRAVIIGRGAHLILNPAHTLRIRCYAPFQWRVEQVARREGLPPSKARTLTARVDAERVQFYREHFKTDFFDPSNFDVLLNASTTSLEARADMIAQAFNAKFPGTPAPFSVAPTSGIRSKPLLGEAAQSSEKVSGA